MFTVKHTASDYIEHLYTATEVRYTPSLPVVMPGQERIPETVWLAGGDAGYMPLTGGRIYVMNDHGATVAKYDLEASIPDGSVGMTAAQAHRAA